MLHADIVYIKSTLSQNVRYHFYNGTEITELQTNVPVYQHCWFLVRWILFFAAQFLLRTRRYFYEMQFFPASFLIWHFFLR